MACSVMGPDNNNRSSSPAYSRIASSASVASIASFPEYDVKPNMRLEDVKNRLAELVGCKGSDLIQACKNFDRRSTNKIPKAQFRQVLRTFCFPLTAAQFNALCNEVNFNQGGKINYVEFFTKISGGKNISSQRTSEKMPDDLPVDEVELRIKEKIKSRLYDVIRAFWLFDINKDGLIQKTELRRIIRNYCFDLSDNLFDDVWKNYDPKSTGVIKYKDFLISLGINADRYQMYMPSESVAQALCWSDKKAKDEMDDICLEQRSRRAAVENRDDPAIQGLPIEEIENVFMRRLQRRYKTLKNIFYLFDYEKNGQISLSEFCGVINFFVLPMSTSLFNRILKRLELNCSDPEYKLNYQDFIERFCKSSGSTQKTAKRDADKLDCYAVVQRIKNHVLNPDSRLRSVFTKISPEKEWQITRQELKKAIECGLDFRLTDEEFRELISILDPGNTNIVNCLDFLQLFEGPCEGSMVCGDNLALGSDLKDPSKYKDLHGNRLKSRLRHHINKNILNVEKAILVTDPHLSGYILSEKLHNILDGICMPLTVDQFKEVISEFQVFGDSINYKEFLDGNKNPPGEHTRKWVSTIDKLATYKSRCPPELPVDEVEEILRECIQSRKTAMLKDFKTLDVCNVGVACKDDARNIFNKFSFRFNDKQFNELWKKFPVNKYDQLIYDQFLEEYAPSNSQPKVKTTPKSTSEPTSDASKPKPERSPDRSSSCGGGSEHSFIQSCEAPHGVSSKRKEENRKSTKEILYARAPHLRNIIDSIEPSIVRNFRTIRFHLRRADPKVTGVVDFNILKNILVESTIEISCAFLSDEQVKESNKTVEHERIEKSNDDSSETNEFGDNYENVSSDEIEIDTGALVSENNETDTYSDDEDVMSEASKLHLESINETEEQEESATVESFDAADSNLVHTTAQNTSSVIENELKENIDRAKKEYLQPLDSATLHMDSNQLPQELENETSDTEFDSDGQADPISETSSSDDEYTPSSEDDDKESDDVSSISDDEYTSNSLSDVKKSDDLSSVSQEKSSDKKYVTSFEDEDNSN
ncbi:EF-hand calcium-binding domain-containing protein 6 [Caerostris darwini]|uniref:EF-hand calcium-binding domain-containing protein 6 n=1 Tax=Caerostris darwini TaxID=1538125 RepID=A0AAV4R723_9ARAC|nr:EF-hand calcium-binding domain-containing protein 6 [Caerostris darwini]